jgi:hypothetical protein
MNEFLNNKEALTIAVQAAIAGDWHKSHNIAQDHSDDVSNQYLANWIHAVLHKIEGDEWNSKYWYARTSINGGYGKKFEDFSDANIELKAILNHLNNTENKE